MNDRSLTIQKFHFIALAILIFGGVLRLVNLDGFPLTNQEAQVALNAAQGSLHGSEFYVAADPQSSAALHDWITRILFELGGASNFNARLASAVAGIGLLFIPLLLKKKQGSGISLLMAAMIAVSPLFVTISRTASAASLAAVAILLTLLIMFVADDEKGDESAYLGSIALGSSLALGRPGFSGLIILTLTLLISLLTSRPDIPRKFRQVGLWLVPLTLLIAVTHVGSSFAGISAFFESLFAYLQSWLLPATYPALSVLMLVPIYAPALLMFGGLGIIQSLRKRTAIDLILVVFLLVSIIFILIYPGRMPEDILWPALALVFFASKYVSRLASEFSKNAINPMSVVIALGIGFLAVRLDFQISASIDPIALIDQPFVQLGIYIFIAAAILVVYGLGWSWVDARHGLLFGLGIIFVSIGISSLWRLNFSPATYSARDLWRKHATTQGLLSLMQTLESTSELSTGSNSGLALQILGPAPSSLKWALRDHKKAKDPAQIAPPIVLLREIEGEPQLIADYVGQALVIGESWGWDSTLPPNFIRWWITKEAPVESERWWILIREDIALHNQGVNPEDF